MSKYSFDTGRFFRVLNYEFSENRSKILSGSGGVAAFLLIIFLLVSLSGNGGKFFSSGTGWFTGILFMSGWALSSTAFQDLHDKEKNYLFFMLPASLTEKLAARILMYGVLFPIYTALGLFILSTAASLLHLILFQSTTGLFNPFNSLIYRMSFIYLITQSFFIYSSVVFRKRAFFKAGMVAAAAQIILLLIFIVMARLFFHNILPGFSADGGMPDLMMDPERILEHLKSYLGVVKFAFYILFAPFFWIISLLKLEESEV